MKVVFLGTPEFALTVLEKLVQSQHEVVAVVCGIDKPQGRGNKLTPPPTKLFAMGKQIPVYQFSKIRVQGVETLKRLQADIFVTAAFGQILSQEIIDIPRLGIVNVHGSLLPAYRGAAPIQYALLNGDKQTGVTIMKTNIGIDDGDMIEVETVDIHPDDNTETLMQKVAVVGAELLVKTLDKIENGTAVFTPQDHTKATFTKMLKKEKALIDFCAKAEEVVNFVRAYNPNPSAHFVLDENKFKVLKAQVYTKPIENQDEFVAGQVVLSSAKQGLVIACGTGFVEVVELQAPGSKVMSAKSYLNGKKIEIGKILNRNLWKD